MLEKNKIITTRQGGTMFREISKSVGRSLTAIKKILHHFQKERKIVSGRTVKSKKECRISGKKARYLFVLSKRNRRKTLPVLIEENNLAADVPFSLSTVRSLC